MKDSKRTAAKYLLPTLLFTAVFGFISGECCGQQPEIAFGIDPSNVCFPGEVYDGLTREPQPLEPRASIEQRINREIAFLHEHPGFDSAAEITFAINCRGSLGGGFHMSAGTGNGELDRQLMDFFHTVDQWRPGEYQNKPVDCWYTWRLVIRNGVVHITNTAYVG